MITNSAGWKSTSRLPCSSTYRPTTAAMTMMIPTSAIMVFS